MATATTTQTTQCRGCGAKIPSTVSICPYCVTPQQTGAAASSQDRTPVMERLAHMREKPEFAEGLAFTPMEGPRFQRALARQKRGLAFVAIGFALVLVGLSAGGALRVLPGIALALAAAVGAARARKTLREILALPLLKRPARVADRRSETVIRGAHGDTTYYFELELDDGTSAEFFYPGRGPAENPLTTGVTGIAYTRGQELVAFKRVRV